MPQRIGQSGSAQCDQRFRSCRTDTLNGQGSQELWDGSEGVDTLNDSAAVIDEAFVLPTSVLTALEA